MEPKYTIMFSSIEEIKLFQTIIPHRVYYSKWLPSKDDLNKICAMVFIDGYIWGASPIPGDHWITFDEWNLMREMGIVA